MATLAYSTELSASRVPAPYKRNIVIEKISFFYYELNYKMQNNY